MTTIEVTPAQKKLLLYLLNDRLRINSREVRTVKDKNLVEYYTNQIEDIKKIIHQLV